MDAQNKTLDDESLTFEDAFRKLERIVAELDDARGGLETSLENFEEGMRLLKFCREKLNAVSRRIELLKGIDERGDAIVEKLDEDSLRSQSETAGRSSASVGNLSRNGF